MKSLKTLKFRIIGLLKDEIGDILTISDISKKLGSAYSHTHKFVQELKEEGIITLKKVGKASIVLLNFNEPLVLSYLSAAEYEKRKKWLSANPWAQRTIEKIAEVKDEAHVILYQKNKLIFIVPQKIVAADFKMFKMRKVITSEDARKMKKELKECIVLYGAEKFWEIIQ